MRTCTAKLERISSPDSVLASGVKAACGSRMIMLKRWLNYSAVAALAGSSLFAQTNARVQTFPLRDASGLIAPQVKAEAVKYLGRESVRITVEGEDQCRPRTAARNRLPGWSDRGGYRAEGHNSAGCQVSRLYWDCLPCQARCIALRVVLPKAGKLRGRGPGDAEPCGPVCL